MHQSLYPTSPSDVPADLTKANANYKKHALLAMVGLMLFMALFIALLTGFVFISFRGVMAISSGHANLAQIAITVCAVLLAIFMLKSLFAVRKASDPGGVEVTAEDEPQLFEFLNTLADEIGAPKPHRVFITPDVNAAVYYDLSLLNLLFPSKKNLIVGLGLVNVLSLGELKAVLAHEFGHFAQGSMLVGRWVYIAQQIIGHMVATRDWLDSLIRFVSRIDLRIAWLGWLLSLVIWSIRSLVDTLFGLVIMAERALSREMEFQADLVAVSVTGSDALVHALHKLQAADHAWQTALSVARSQAAAGRKVDDLFAAQSATVNEMRRVLDDKDYGAVPVLPDQGREHHRVFKEEFARPPQMWATHPANRDREDNAKAYYVKATIDQRPSWDVFSDPHALRQATTLTFYNTEKIKELEPVPPLEAVLQRFNRPSYAPEFRGAYLNRSTVRNFASVSDMLSAGTVLECPKQSIAQLYPESLKADLDNARNLDIEKATLEALARGELTPSGGVIRHRGEELRKHDIPDAVEGIQRERQAVAEKLMAHDASCRRAYLLAAQEFGRGWYDYYLSIIRLLHCAEHMCAKVADEHALLVNTWQVITADGQVGFFEKRRMIAVAEKVQQVMHELSEKMLEIKLPGAVNTAMGVEDWHKQCPRFDLVEVTRKNWFEWCPAASNALVQIENALAYLQNEALDELIRCEASFREHLNADSKPQTAPIAGSCPAEYPVLLPGDEHKLQRKLDLWNRFQLAHGAFPTLARLLVSLGIVGGTLTSGLLMV